MCHVKLLCNLKSQGEDVYSAQQARIGVRFATVGH